MYLMGKIDYFFFFLLFAEGTDCVSLAANSLQ